MSDQSPSSPFPSMPIPDFALGPLIEANRRAFDRWMHGLFECGRELGAFAATRFDANLQSWTSLIDSKSLDQVMQHQTGFLQQAVADYIEETGKLTRVMIDATAAIWESGPAPADKASGWTVAPAPQAAPRPAAARAPAGAAAETPAEHNG